MNHNDMTRRGFLGAATACGLAATGCATTRVDIPASPEGLPLVDLHVHPDKSTVDAIVALSREQGVLYGMVEHAGTKENVYPRMLSNDEELLAWTRELEGKGVYKGVQAEWLDWSSCFSKKALATLDYVLTDTMTIPRADGTRMKMWEKEAVIDDRADWFMDDYVDWYLYILGEQPVDMLANVSWLPEKFAKSYATLWTPKRVEKVVDMFVQRGIAMEISSSFLLPKMHFLRIAKEAGVKFCFGSNGRYPNMGKLDYSLQTAKELGLKKSDMWLPRKNGARAAQG
jgi:histidinol phosphatase-like PHP family hydrolase